MNDFWHSDLFRNTSIMISGTMLAQLIPIILQPALRRLYTAETFGAFAVYFSLTSIFAIISSLKYDMAIVLPKDAKTAANVFFLSVIINLFFSLLLALIILIWHEEILIFLNLTLFPQYLFIVPAGVFFYGTYQCLNSWLIREKGFLPVSINKFVRRGSEGTTQIVMGLARNGNGIIFGEIFGHISNLITGIIQVRKRKLSLKLVSRQKIKYVASKFSEFPKYNTIPSFMSACSYLLPAIFLNKFYSTEDLGFFDFSKLLLSIPLALIASSLSNVLLQKMSESYREKKSLKRELLSVAVIISVIAVFETIIISLFGIDLFKFFFGADWEMSGIISRILVWSYALNFIVASFSAVFVSLNKIKLYSIWQVMYFLSILSLIFFRDLKFLDFLKIYVIIEVLCYLVIIFITFRIVVEYENMIAKESTERI